MKVPSFDHSSRASSLFPGFIVFFLICYIHRMEPAQFTVTGPDHPVTATVGEAIVLPCHLSPKMNAENMKVRWFRPEFASFVHMYQDGKDLYGEQMPDYHGRTEFLKDGITDGNVSLKILNVRRSDEGQYSCFVQDDLFYEEAILELKVAGLGSNPLISVESHQDGGIRMVCQSAGWYPEPKVLWRDLRGQELPSLSEAKSLGDNGLFATENSIIIKERSNQNLSCWISNTFFNQGKESTIYIADSFFPKVNPWMVALVVFLVVLFGFIGLTAYLFKIKGEREAEIEKHLGEIDFFFPKVNPWMVALVVFLVVLFGFIGLTAYLFKIKGEREAEIEKHLGEIVDRDTKIGKQRQDIIDRDTKIGKQRQDIIDRDTKIDKLQGELSWEKARQHAVDVTLDPDTAHPNLVLSEGGKRVRYGNTRQDLPDNPERFDYCRCVLGAEGFAGGRRYWEVEVGGKTEWELGVCRESVRRKEWVTLSPGNGYWVVWLRDGGYEAFTSPPTPLSVSARPSRVGVFLDYEAGEVSFYNVTDRSHLFTFTGTFSGTLRPYFNPGYDAAPLSICPVPAQAGGNPGP